MNVTTSELSQQLPGKERSISNLIGYLNNRASDVVNYSLFLGAGASVTSGIPTGGCLVKKWRQDLYNEHNPHTLEENQIQIKEWLSKNIAGYDSDSEYGYLFDRNFSMPKQRRDFIESQISGKLPSIGYPYLVRLAEKRAFNVVFTTNFDDLLNEAFYQFSSERPVVCAHDSSIGGISVASTRTKIIKLHGDCLYSNLKNTTSETSQLTTNMEDKLREFAKLFGLIVVGYSGCDESIMRILNTLVDDPLYFQNGLYWCFRKGDEISSNTLQLLRKPSCFYVIIEGFDELMADLYTAICGNSLPFNARPGSDFAAKIIKSYLEDGSSKSSSNPTIISHLNILSDEQNSSLVAEALQSLYKEQGDETKIKDSDFIKYVELQRLFRSRDYKNALQAVRNYIDQCGEITFKRILAERLYHAAKSLYQPREAIAAIDLLRELEPENTFLCLPLCDVTDDKQERLNILIEGVQRAPYEEAIHLRYASELQESFDMNTTKDRPSAPQVVEAYKTAIKLHPVIGNPAWSDLFDFLKNPLGAFEERETLMRWIVDEHMTQDAHDYRSISLLVSWSKATQSDKYLGKSVAEWVLQAFERHFPRRYSGHLSVIRDLCIDTGEFSLLSHVIPICEKEENIKHDSSFIKVKMDLLYRIYRDPSSAIEIGEEFIKRRPSATIENSLFYLYLAINDLDKAKYQLDRLTGALEFDYYLKLKSTYLDHCDKWQDAIDTLKPIASRGREDVDYIITLSYLQLRLGDHKGAFETTKKFFEGNNYSLKYENAMINYEYSRLCLKKSVSQSRLTTLARTSSNKSIKSVAHLLLGEDSKAFDLISGLIRSDFSVLNSCKRWPVMSSLSTKIDSLETQLLAERRTYPFTDVGILSSPIDVVEITSK